MTNITSNQTLIRYVGAKNRIAKHIIRIIESIPHKRYCEVFGGSASVLLHRPKPKKVLEIYNDADELISTLFTVLADRSKYSEFMERLRYPMTSKKQFDDCKEYLLKDSLQRNEIDTAYCVYYVQSLAFAGKLFNQAFVPDARIPSIAKRVKTLGLFAERLAEVFVTNFDWRKVIDLFDSVDTLFYFDPPYLYGTQRFKYPYYKNTLTFQDHVNLVNKLITLKGRAILSCYDDAIYKPLLQHGYTLQQVYSTVSVNKMDTVESTESLYIKG